MTSAYHGLGVGLGGAPSLIRGSHVAVGGLLDQYRNASLAYSLRRLRSDYTGHAVRIRRESDDIEVNVSFDTNDEVSTSSPIENTTEQGGESGSTAATTLGEFLTEDIDITNRLIVPSDVATRFVVTSSTDASNYTVSINNGSGEATFSHMRSGLFSEGHYRLRGTLTASNLVGEIKIQTNGGLPDNTQFVSITNGINNLDFEFDITGDGSTTSAGSVKLFFFINDVASATLEVSNLTWEVTTPDASVHTWYDQSGNSKNATQEVDANQPLISESGTLIKRNGKPAVKSTSDNVMNFTMDSLSSDGQQSVFAVLENEVSSQDGYGDVFNIYSTSSESSGRNRRPLWFSPPTGNRIYLSADELGGYYDVSTDYHLFTHTMNNTSGGTSTIFKDGAQVDTRSITLDANPNFSQGRIAGVTSNATGALYMAELIYYTSDQILNRPAIEANIANQYGIALS